ncbi:uncharacterized protein LOC101746757 isoform X1 [Bombyx mori]|uniref:BRCT domain-containing protein n=1 Tax=Bombyx mori TaxID=7091 RepID=A0A8R1WH24_BOMMO|nr:uncharacterized protein LOC101746757 isoform X1 [Bombyx mori]
MNNQSAAGLRRSAVAERIRLREEWSALKGTQNQLQSRKDCESIAKQKKTHNWTSKVRSVKNNVGIVGKENKNSEIPMTSEALRGIVALVEVGSASKALALRAALTALGASVMPKWSPLVTHLIWSQGGCRSVRRRARALACRLVSPMWVEACATAARRIPETTFPAAARQSDIPSPRTLRQLLKKAEMENVSIMDLLSDKEEREAKQLRFRVSTDSEANSSGDVTVNTSRDQSNDTIDLGTRVNTAPRRALPASASISPRPPVRSRRKLFTQKEPEAESSTDAESDNENKDRQNKTSKKLTQKDRNGLAQAERMARKMLGQRTDITSARSDAEYRIVLTGMNRDERHEVVECVRALGGRVLSRVNRTTTHVLLGSCRAAPHATDAVSGVAPHTQNPDSQNVNVDLPQKARTLNSLEGAARGCRVLAARWARDSAAAGRWLHHAAYEVPHLKKISQKARLERAALGKRRSEYAYDVFSGMRVHVSAGDAQEGPAARLLALCGAELCPAAADADLAVGAGAGTVACKWVFDSVAAARMRTVRRYIN